MDINARLDNIIMEEVNVNKLIRTVQGLKPEFCMVLNRGDSEYYFTVDGKEVELTETTKKALINKLLNG